MILIHLFLAFFKIGLFTFGGGYAMISIIENVCVEKHKWITHDDMMNIVVIAESTPGPIAINCATFVGYRQKGLAGAIAATLGLVMPSFIIIYVISLFLDNFLEITWAANAFLGIKAAVGILILDAGINMIRKMKERKKLETAIISCACAVILLTDIFSMNFSSVGLMLIAAVIGLAVYIIGHSAEKKGGKTE